MSRPIVLAALGLSLVGCSSPDEAANRSAAERQSAQAKAMGEDARFKGGASPSKSPIPPNGADPRGTGGAPADYASAMAQQQRMRGGR